MKFLTLKKTKNSFKSLSKRILDKLAEILCSNHGGIFLPGNRRVEHLPGKQVIRFGQSQLPYSIITDFS